MVLRLTLLALVGTICGALLGEMVAGQRLGNRAYEPATYSGLSANPDAAAPPAIGEDPCPMCPDSYGVAAHLRAERQDRMDNAFRSLGSIEPEMPAEEIDDGYRYGGRFPDREIDSRAESTAGSIGRDDQPIPAEDILAPSAEVP